MRSLEVQSKDYATRWFQTLYSADLPGETAARILDVFLAEGPKILFRVAIAILRRLQPDVMRLGTKAEVIAYLAGVSDAAAAWSEDEFVTEALAVQVDSSLMARLEAEFQP